MACIFLLCLQDPATTVASLATSRGTAPSPHPLARPATSVARPATLPVTALMPETPAWTAGAATTAVKVVTFPGIAHHPLAVVAVTTGRESASGWWRVFLFLI